MAKVRTARSPSKRRQPPPADPLAGNVARLKALPLFHSLPESDLHALAGVVKTVYFDQYQTIFKDNDPGDTLYLLCSGAVQFWIVNAAGEEVPFEEITEGVFGEVAVLHNGRRSATARATRDTIALEVKRDDLLPILHAQPDIAGAIMRDMARRLGRTSKDLRRTTVRNPNTLIQETMPRNERIHRTARYCGSLSFLAWNIVLYALWVGLNLWRGGSALDRFPFHLLALLIAIEAFAVTCVVLHSQNRLAEHERIRNDAEFEANLKAEQEIKYLHEKLDELRAEMRQRLPAPAQAVTQIMPDKPA